MKSGVIYLLFLILISGCGGSLGGFQTDSSGQPDKQSVVPEHELPVIEDLPDLGERLIPLAWESSSQRERTEWSGHTYQLIVEHFSKLNQVQDASRFCPRYDTLTMDQKINFWGQLIAGISYFESGWNPTTRFHESTMGTDPITKQPVYSEGLLQLSYQDIQWARWCEFNWEQDRKLAPRDPRRTILNPFRNLTCGVGILARQIERHKKIVINRGVYWAVIRENGRYQKINQIASIVQRHSYCRP